MLDIRFANEISDQRHAVQAIRVFEPVEESGDHVSGPKTDKKRSDKFQHDVSKIEPNDLFALARKLRDVHVSLLHLECHAGRKLESLIESMFLRGRVFLDEVGVYVQCRRRAFNALVVDRMFPGAGLLSGREMIHREPRQYCLEAE